MFVTDRAIFLQLQKTGSMHICKLLAILIGGYEKNRHLRLENDFETAGKIIVSSIRDPWRWYLSLWSYGCRASMYGLRARLTSEFSNPECTTHTFLDQTLVHQERMRSIEKWRRVYSDANNPALFQQWLLMLLDPERCDDLGECYSDYHLHEFAGFFTHRYIRLHSRDLHSLNSVNTLEELKTFDKEQNIVDAFIRNEHLEDDFIAVLRRAGYPPLSAHQIDFIRNAERTNASSGLQNIENYYNENSIELVARKEAFIIDKHKYPKAIRLERANTF